MVTEAIHEERDAREARDRLELAELRLMRTALIALRDHLRDGWAAEKEVASCIDDVIAIAPDREGGDRR